MDPEIRVTRINDRYHSRLILEGTVKDEMACECREDIGWICRELLRWHHKMGHKSQYADKARHRQFYKPSRIRGLHGKIWYRGELKQKNKVPL